MSQFEGNRICHGLITGDMRELSQSVSFRHSRPRPKFRFGNFGVDTAEKGTIKNAMHKEDSDLSSWKRCWAAAWPVAHSPGVKERRYRYTTKRVRETILPNGAHLYSWTYSSETFVKLTFPKNIQKSRCTIYFILHANLRNLMLTSVHQKARLSSSVNCANVRIRSNIFWHILFWNVTPKQRIASQVETRGRWASSLALLLGFRDRQIAPRIVVG